MHNNKNELLKTTVVLISILVFIMDFDSQNYHCTLLWIIILISSFILYFRKYLMHDTKPITEKCSALYHVEKGHLTSGECPIMNILKKLSFDDLEGWLTSG